MILIGLCGKKRHGKDTAADAIIQARGRESQSAYHHIPFIKELTHKYYDIQKFGFGDLVRDEIAFQRPNTVNRQILQNWGQSKREIYQDYWVLKMDALVLRERPEVAMITGIRFDNEWEWLKSYGGYLIHVHRAKFNDPEPGTDDISEQFDCSKADLTISSVDGRLTETRKMAVRAFDSLMELHGRGI